MTAKINSTSTQAAPNSLPASSQRPWVVLAVDDEADVLDSLKDLLEQSNLGIKVITAASGRMGIEILERERVDLVLSDFQMPGMDGIEFLVQARRLRPALPRMMLTAFANKDLAARALSEAVVTDFLAKSLSPDQMVQKVEALLHYAPESPSHR